MVGVVYVNLKPGEPCYIVLKNGGGNDFLEGRFLGVLPDTDPAWNHFAERGLPSYAKPAQAIVTDPAALHRDALDPIVLRQVPGRAYYAIIPVREYTHLLENKLYEAQQETGMAKRDLTSYIGQSALLMDDFISDFQKERKDHLLFYLLIGVAFGIAGGLGIAAYDNYQRMSDKVHIQR